MTPFDQPFNQKLFLDLDPIKNFEFPMNFLKRGLIPVQIKENMWYLMHVWFLKILDLRKGAHWQDKLSNSQPNLMLETSFKVVKDLKPISQLSIREHMVF